MGIEKCCIFTMKYNTFHLRFFVVRMGLPNQVYSTFFYLGLFSYEIKKHMFSVLENMADL